MSSSDSSPTAGGAGDPTSYLPPNQDPSNPQGGNPVTNQLASPQATQQANQANPMTQRLSGDAPPLGPEMGLTRDTTYVTVPVDKVLVAGGAQGVMPTYAAGAGYGSGGGQPPDTKPPAGGGHPKDHAKHHKDKHRRHHRKKKG